MASTARQNPAADYFSGPTRPQINTITTYDWDNISDPTLTSDSCDSLSSPTSPDSLIFPQNCYALPKDEHNPKIKTEQPFNFGTFEDWMRWDDPSDAALSPSSTNDFYSDFKLEPTSPSMSMNGLELQGGISSSSLQNQSQSQTQDESAIFGEVNEEPLFQTPGSLITPPLDLSLSRETLYSTPLSWTRPQHRANSYTSLTPQEESKLRSIAMPPSQNTMSQQQNTDNYPASPSSSSSPEPSSSSLNRRKRKSSIEDDNDDEAEDSPPPTSNSSRPVKKTAHNMIEKRYRTNLNDKIAALRDSVPSLRVMSKKNSRGEEVHEDLQGLTPAHKLNKATVLSKATEYIAHLEKRNKYLVKENAALKSRVDAFEILVMSRQQPGQQVQKQQRRQSNQGMTIGQMGQGYAGMM